MSAVSAVSAVSEEMLKAVKQVAEANASLTESDEETTRRENLHAVTLAAQRQSDRIAAVMKQIYDSIPERVALNSILSDAVELLREAAGEPIVGAEQAHRMLITSNVATVLREIATYAVEQYTRRTGERFEWKDDPEPEPEEPLMHFALNEKGEVVF